MKTLEEPPRHPERFPYVRIDHPLCDWMRVPTPGEIQDAVAQASECSGARQTESIAGAVIRLCWRDHRRELESGDAQAVFVEMHEAGHKSDEIYELADVMQKQFRKEHGITDEAIKKARDFTETTPSSE